MTELRDTQKRVAWRCALSAMDKRLEIGDTAYDALRAAVKAFADVYDEECALIQKEQAGWRPMSEAPKDGTLMLLELDDGSLKLGRYHKSPTYSFLWWSEDAAPLSEPRRWCPTPPQGEDG